METMLPPVARLRLAGETRLLYAGQRLLIGRAAENDIVLSDPKISRVHAVLEWNGSGFTIQDQDSANGTCVNGARISEVPVFLRDGDAISLSRQLILYEIARAETSHVLAARDAEKTARASDSPRLVVAAGPDEGQEYALWGEVVTIGRASREATWEIRLTDRSVSRPHARLERCPEGYTLTDLDSANGTCLNGAPLTSIAVLHAGDSILVGESTLVFVVPGCA